MSQALLDLIPCVTVQGVLISAQDPILSEKMFRGCTGSQRSRGHNEKGYTKSAE